MTILGTMVNALGTMVTILGTVVTDLGNVVTIQCMVGDHPANGVRPSFGNWLTVLGILWIMVTVLWIDGDHPWDGR